MEILGKDILFDFENQKQKKVITAINKFRLKVCVQIIWVDVI